MAAGTVGADGQQRRRDVFAVADALLELAVDCEAQLEAIVVDGRESAQRLRDPCPRR